MLDILGKRSIDIKNIGAKGEEKRQSLGTQTPREWVTCGESASGTCDTILVVNGVPSGITGVNILKRAHHNIGKFLE